MFTSAQALGHNGKGQSMNRSTVIPFVSFLVIMLCHPVFTSQAIEFEEIQQLEERLNRLEQEAATLRSDIAVIKSQLAVDPTYDSQQNTNPMFGTWECTNNVFTYELSLMADGVVITKEMSTGRIQHGKWLRRGKEDIVISTAGHSGGGSAHSFRVIDLSDDRMSLEEPNAQSIYDCSKLSQE